MVKRVGGGEPATKCVHLAVSADCYELSDAELDAVLDRMADAFMRELEPSADRRLVGAISADASDEEIDAFLDVLNAGMPEAN